ncbi:hypothetical protein ApDm4_0201 [Acetobacter pomorum]|nr:hypothetical protein ApDm4_0201 [Acetobacter pomorum]
MTEFLSVCLIGVGRLDTTFPASKVSVFEHLKNDFVIC